MESMHDNDIGASLFYCFYVVKWGFYYYRKLRDMKTDLNWRQLADGVNLWFWQFEKQFMKTHLFHAWVSATFCLILNSNNASAYCVVVRIRVALAKG